MSTMVLEKRAAPRVAGEATILVDVQVLLDDGSFVFQSVIGRDYVIGPTSISLLGSASGPQGFKLVFTLTESVTKEGYTFDNPALLFSQAGAQGAGFFFPPEASRTEATAALFNALTIEDPTVTDTFLLQLMHPVRGSFFHDPTIVWDPPGGG